jgi:tetratricopeptide (TPR) repeat protein
VILSAEQFSRFKTAEHVTRLRDFLAPYFAGISVIVYLRRQDTHFASFYTQSLRLGHVEPPDVTQLLKHHHTYDYAEILDRWAGVFGEKAMVVRVFERGADRKFDVLEDFAAICGIAIPADPKPRPADANPAINLAGQQVLRLLGAKIQAQTGQKRVGGNGWHRLCYHITDIAPGRGWQPTRAEARQLVSQFADSNEAVRARWFPSRATLFTEDFDALPETAEPPPSGDVLDVMATAFAEVVRTAVRKEQEMRVEKAMLADELGDPDRCIDLLTKAVRRDGRDVEARIALAQMQMRAKDYRKARVNIDAVLELDPDNKMVRKLNTRLQKRTAARPEA